MRRDKEKEREERLLDMEIRIQKLTMERESMRGEIGSLRDRLEEVEFSKGRL